MNAAILAASLIPLAASTPLETSTAAEHCGHGLSDIVVIQPAGQNQRQRQVSRQQGPVKRGTGATVCAFDKGVGE
jgi:hypothetical protein